MDKQQLVDLIKNSDVSDKYKTELLQIVESSPEITDRVMTLVGDKLNEYADSIVRDINNIQTKHN